MKNIGINRIIICLLPLMLFCASVWAEDMRIIVPAKRNYRPEAPRFFSDSSGLPQLAYYHKELHGLGELYYLKYRNENWSSPIKIDIPFENIHGLHEVVNLDDGSPLMLFGGDNTNYEQLLPLRSSFPSEEEYLKARDKAIEIAAEIAKTKRRIFFSLQKNGRWTSPLPVPESYLSVGVAAAAGENRSALLAFSRDRDGDPKTVGDIELYASLFNGLLWTTPQRITANNKIEYNVRVQYIQGKYLLAWTADEDANPETPADKKLRYALISADGSVQKTDALITDRSLEYVELTLGIRQNQGILLWGVSERDADASVDIIKFSVRESRFNPENNTWSEPKETELPRTLVVSESRLYSTAEGLILVFSQGGALRAAYNDGTVWHPAATLYDFASTHWQSSETAHFMTADGKLYLAVSGLQAASPSEEKQNELGADQISLTSDLSLSATEISPRQKHIGQEIAVKFSVVNQGLLPANDFKVKLFKNDLPVQSYRINSLYPGKTEDIEYKFALERAFSRLEFQIETNSPENNTDNNTLSVPIKALPDYRIRSVNRLEPGKFLAVIEELKGIAAPPITVDGYLIQGKRKTPLGNIRYDINTAAPLVIELPAPPVEGESFKLEVAINKERKIAEDDYSNNKETYLYKALPDFLIGKARMDSENLYVTILNQGNSYSDRVDLLLTSDPASAVQSSASENDSLYRIVEMKDKTEREIVIPLSELKTDSDIHAVYAMVNPFAKIRELDLKNNDRKIFSYETAGAEATADNISIAYSGNYCDGLRLGLSNSGNTIIAPAIKVFNQDGVMKARTSLPVLEGVSYHGRGRGHDKHGDKEKHGHREVVLGKLDPGEYTMEIAYFLSSGLQVTERKEFEAPEHAECDLSISAEVKASHTKYKISPRARSIFSPILISCLGNQTPAQARSSRPWWRETYDYFVCRNAFRTLSKTVWWKVTVDIEAENIKEGAENLLLTVKEIPGQYGNQYLYLENTEKKFKINIPKAKRGRGHDKHEDDDDKRGNKNKHGDDDKHGGSKRHERENIIEVSKDIKITALYNDIMFKDGNINLDISLSGLKGEEVIGNNAVQLTISGDGDIISVK